MKTNLIRVDKLTNAEFDFIDNEFLNEDDSLVLVVETGNGNKAHFIYRVNEDVSCHFNLLCEVGQGYIRAYKELLAENKLMLKNVETANDYFNIVAPVE